MATEVLVDIWPVEIDGEHFVRVAWDGHEVDRKGPFADADAARQAARGMLERCRRLFAGPPSWIATPDARDAGVHQTTARH